MTQDVVRGLNHPQRIGGPVSTHSMEPPYVVRDTDRDGLQAKLAEHGIGTLIHYPIPPHRQQAYDDQSFSSLPVAERMAEQVLSLPLGPHLDPEQQERVIAVLGQLLAARA